jgi:hypothetical protein
LRNQYPVRSYGNIFVISKSTSTLMVNLFTFYVSVVL